MSTYKYKSPTYECQTVMKIANKSKMPKLQIIQTIWLLAHFGLVVHARFYDLPTVLQRNDGNHIQKQFLLGQFEEFLEDKTSVIRMQGKASEDPANQVAFRLYTKAAPNDSVLLEPSLESISKSPFDAYKETRFMTHGFWSNGESDTSLSIKNAYLTYQDVNVILVDWKDAAATVNYIKAAMSTIPIGAYTAKMLDSLVEFGADPKQIHLIGHSLGAHISGFAGKFSKYQVRRITGLDPAAPLFESFKMIDDHLSVGNADFVDVIHTSAGSLGYKAAIGNVDFYPNKGNAPQPGCKDATYLLGDVATILDGCSHGRSWMYFVESINPRVLYKSEPAMSGNVGKVGKDFSFVQMGEFVDPHASGTYYLETNNQAPYSLTYAT